MTSLKDTKLWIGILFTTIFISLGYEFRDHFIDNANISIKILGLLIGILLSGIMTNILIKITLSSKFGRMLFMKDGWVEGYWNWNTYFEENSAINSLGVMYLSYTGNNYELRAVVYRSSPHGNVAQYTHTEFASLRDYDGRYFNYATLPKGDTETKVYAIGRFFKDSSTFYPNVYEGNVVVDGKIKSQTARKISNKIVKEYKKTYGENWMSNYIKDNSPK